MRREPLIIVHLVERQAAGVTFQRSRAAWPLHITLVPWFEAEISREAELLSAIERYAKSSAIFTVLIGTEEEFGPGKDVPVNLIADQLPVMQLRDGLLRLAKRHGVVFSSQVNSPSSAAGKTYRAHITHHVVDGAIHRRFPGDKEVFTDITVARLFEKDGTQVCEILQNFALGSGGSHETAT